MIDHPVIKMDLSGMGRDERARVIANHYSRAFARADALVNAAFGGEPPDIRLNLTLISKPGRVSTHGNLWRDVDRVRWRGTNIKLHLSCGHVIERRAKGREYKGEYQREAICRECGQGVSNARR